MPRTSYQYKNSFFQASGLFPPQHLGSCLLTLEPEKTLREWGNISDETRSAERQVGKVVRTGCAR